MNALNKYILIIIVTCLSAIYSLNGGGSKQNNKSINKDSISKIDEPKISDEERIQIIPIEEVPIENNSSNNEDNTDWKFKKHIILLN